MEDIDLVNELVQKEILLEVCPTSNMQTKAINELKSIEEIYRKGIKIAINTDNNTVSNTNIIEEYKYILENTELTINDLQQMNINAIRGAFINPQKKAELIGRVSKEEEILQR